ncbi:HAD family hydrolase [Paenibacillus eucommiae]|uniref:Phosphoglycolate phosphatase-like HAD superfamily hydrolase n=1 Tax=Paenibacillus eucommiae TaxID=1355755 RepID=A0ABS4J1J7_9BACL|nr:HAD family hydrolase [Paenibacillus eucommiae]MBP1993694.1 phosphoglycolate phosphatase-like HAD superfamily hydrolase [Paenibacillus eucommiae]
MAAEGNAAVKVKVALFDFDGTISTLRAGWEEVMAPMMMQAIAGDAVLSAGEKAELEREIAAYIDQSTGIQTIYQMEWLVGKVREKGWNDKVLDGWGYKAEYNELLLLKVKERISLLEKGELQAEHYIMAGAVAFLQQLAAKGIDMYVASGTDHPDVVKEAEVLGVASYFKEIVGAPPGRAECSKEKVIGDLIASRGFSGSELVVIGDGKVEIRLAKENGGLALGLASDEERREGINPVKEKRLAEAGADWIAGDFLDQADWLRRLGFE